MDNNHSGQPLQAGSSEKLLPSAPASTSPFPPDVKATTGLTEVQVKATYISVQLRPISFYQYFSHNIYIEINCADYANLALPS